MVSEGNTVTYHKPQAVGEGKGWVDQWREPKGSRAVVLGFLVLASIASVDILVYATGGTVYVWAHLMYLPIILAASGFKIRGGVVAALIGGLTLGPFMPLNVAAELPQTTSNWVFRVCFFILVGAFSGLISKIFNKQIGRIKRREEHIQYIVNNTKEAIFQIDLDGNYIYGNDAAEQLTGYPLSQLLQMNMLQLTALEYQPLIKERLQLQTADEKDEKAFEIEIQHKDGHRIWTELTTRKVYDHNRQIIGIQGVARDITERKRAAEAVTLFRTLLDHANDTIEVIDPKTGRFLDINEKACRVHGYTREEYMALTVSDLDPGFTGKSWNAHVETLQKFGYQFFETEHRRKDGSIFPVEVNANYIHLGRDYILAVVRDITERKNMERSIRQLNRVYAVLSGINELIVREKNPQAMFEGACRIAVDKGNFHLAWIGLLKNPSEPVQLVAHAGASADTLSALHKVFNDPALGCAFTKQALATGKHSVCNDVAHAPEAAPWRQLALERGYLSLVSLPLNLRGQRAGVMNIYAGESGFFDAGELRLLDELAGDISFALELNQQEIERKQLEEQFRQVQKMESIGQLAGGVAHDFNNILAVIQMQSDLLKESCEPASEQMEFANEINAASQRAAALTRQLLLFSSKQRMQLQDLDLNESINHLTKLLRRTLGDNVQVQFKFAMEKLFVHADAGMMDQVLMNLAVNARDAMPNGGKIVIETSAVDFDELAATQSAKIRPGSFVCLSVSDTGSGIAPENLPRIFEPFFTTKDVGKGTGLGLATVFGIVQQHQGWVDVYSEVGHGTTFRIYVPRAAETTQARKEKSPPVNLRGGNETILLIEDDAHLRASFHKALAQLGYRVLEAASGGEGLEVWKQHRNEVDLLLSDMVMPGGITGKDVGDQLLKENPKLKIVYTSGYSPEIAGKDFGLKEGLNYLIKPFSAAKLAQIIRTNLDRLA